MANKVIGMENWEMSIDEKGYRTYTADFRLQSDDVDNGPFSMLSTPLLPALGSTWTFGNDDDQWVYRSPEVKMRPVVSGEKDDEWIATLLFTNKPFSRCLSTPMENPLLEPYTLGGSFRKYPKLATKDRFGKPLTYSSHESMKGDLVKIQDCKPTIEIGFNIPWLPFSTISLALERLNDAPLWGFPRRMVKFTDVTYTQKYYGTCWKYYTVNYTFEISVKGWDPDILDEGQLVLKKGGNKFNPKDFEKAKDDKDENKTILLDGNGSPLTNIDMPVYLHKEILLEADLLLLGIPSVL